MQKARTDMFKTLRNTSDIRIHRDFTNYSTTRREQCFFTPYTRLYSFALIFHAERLYFEAYNRPNSGEDDMETLRILITDDEPGMRMAVERSLRGFKVNLPDVGEEVSFDVTQAATGEEADSRGALHRIPKHAPAACVIGEPSGADGVTIGYRGSLRIALSASDGGAHRSSDAGPVTAVVRAAADILSFVESVDSPELPVIQRPSGAVVSMHGEENGRRLGRSDLDIRLPEGSDPQQWIEHVMELTGRRGVNARVLAVTPAHVADKNNTAARALRLAVRKNGLNPRLLAKGGTADFNLAAAWNCPMAAYGPGDSKLDHTAEEHISLSEYLTSLDILTDAIPAIMRSA